MSFDIRKGWSTPRNGHADDFAYDMVEFYAIVPITREVLEDADEAGLLLIAGDLAQHAMTSAIKRWRSQENDRVRALAQDSPAAS